MTRYIQENSTHNFKDQTRLKKNILDENLKEKENIIFHFAYTSFLKLRKKVSPIYMDEIEDIFTKSLKKLPGSKELEEEKKIMLGHGKTFLQLTVSPVRKPTKRSLFLLFIFISIVIHYYLNNYRGGTFCYSEFKNKKLLAEKEWNKVFIIKDSVDIHKKEMKHLQGRINQTRALLPVKESKKNWIISYEKPKDEKTMTPIEKEHKENIDKYEDLQVIIEALGMDTDEKTQKRFEEAKQRYDDDIERYLRDEKKCKVEKSFDRLYITSWTTLFMLAQIYDSTIIRWVIDIIPYSNLFSNYIKVDRLGAWGLFILYMKYYGYKHIINDFAIKIFEQGINSAKAGVFSEHLIYIIAGIIFSSVAVYNASVWLLTKELPGLFEGTKQQSQLERSHKKIEELNEVIKNMSKTPTSKSSRRNTTRTVKTPTVRRPKIPKKNTSLLSNYEEEFEKRLIHKYKK